MQATDVVAIVAAVCVAVLAGAFVMMLADLARTLRELRAALAELTEVAGPLVADLRDTVSEAAVELDRVERLVTSAETVTGTIDSASRLAYRTLASPVVKAMALRAGVSRASQRLRGEEGDDRQPDPPGADADPVPKAADRARRGRRRGEPEPRPWRRRVRRARRRGAR